MVKQEKLENGLLHTFSDAGKTLLQKETGLVYDEAIDIYPCRYTYEEMNEPIDEEQTI